MQNLLKSISLVAILMISFKSHSQRYFYPDFTEMKRDFKNIKEINAFLGYETYSYFSKNLGYIITKQFSTTPVIICLNKGVPESKLKQLTNECNLEIKKSVENKDFVTRLKSFISKNRFDKKYIDESMDKPLKIDTTGSTTMYFIDKVNMFIKLSKDGEFESFTHCSYDDVLNQNLKISEVSIMRDLYSIGFGIDIYNYADRAIKYTTINCSIYNTVGDKIATKSVKGVGYILANDMESFLFDHIFYSDVIGYITIDSIILQYDNGTKKIIPKSKIEKITQTDFTKEDIR